jgi:hypothetical protein
VTDYTTSVGLQIRLTGVTGDSFDIRTRQNVKKHVADILYLETPPSDAVKLEYVGSSELLPITNLFIGDRSDSLFENSRTGSIVEFVSFANPIDLRNKNFLCTQAFAESDRGDIPLYYKHILSTNIVPESVRIFNKSLEEVSSDKYRLLLIEELNEDTGLAFDPPEYTAYHLYNDLKSTFNPVTGEYEVYFLQYTEDVLGTETTYTILLDNEPAYTEATPDDIWYLTLGLKPWSTAYLLSDDLQLTMPATAKTAIRFEEEKRIRVSQPATTFDTDPWFTRIVNGSFRSGYAGYGTAGNVILSLLYKIPEFSNQAFNPLEPYKTAINQRCNKIDDTLIKLPNENIQSGSFFSYLYITFENDGVAVAAITNNVLYDGAEYRDIDGRTVVGSDGDNITWSTDMLLGLDRLSGIAHIDLDIRDSYDIFATYSYSEDYYVLSSLNMNPIFDQDVHHQIRAVYLVPQSACNRNLGTQESAIQWLKVNTAGLIEVASQNSLSTNEDIAHDVSLHTTSGYKIDGVIGLHYNRRASTITSSPVEVIPGVSVPVSSTSSFPRKGWIRMLDADGHMRYMYYTDITDTTFVLSSDSLQVPSEVLSIDINVSTTIELVNLIDERTTQTSREPDGELDAYPDFISGDDQDLPAVFCRYFLLAEMTINPPHSIQDAARTDLRENGGGIIESLYEEAKQKNPEVQWYTNRTRYAGQPYPGNAVAVVKLPETIKNTFTDDQIKDIVERSLPFGIQPIIRYLGYEPRIISVSPCGGYVTVKWQKEGSEFVYDIWYSESSDGPWQKHNEVRLIDDPVRANNIHVVTDLEDGKKYFIKVTMQDKYYLWGYSYTAYNSIGGGFGLDTEEPTPNPGNSVDLQIYIDTA